VEKVLCSPAGNAGRAEKGIGSCFGFDDRKYSGALDGHGCSRRFPTFLWLVVCFSVVLLFSGTDSFAGETLSRAEKEALLKAERAENAILRMRSKYPERNEYPYLPRFCGAKIESMHLKREGKTIPPDLARERARWSEVLGRTVWTYMHHYCAGINRLRRFEESLSMGFGSSGNITKMQKDTLVEARDELAFVEVPFLKSGSIMYVEAIVNQANAMQSLGNPQDAISKLSDGIRVKPTSEDLYLALAKLLLDLGEKDEAKKVLELGSRQTGGAKNITEMLSRLP
jgi:tetratricopeptide (TPR) repeat protein